MAVSNKFIREDLERLGALTVHEVAIIDFLNAVGSPEALDVGIIRDDPRVGASLGYGVGEIVAQRIIDKRNGLPGRKFTELGELNNIKGFGEDKFHDLLYTFVKVRIPLPSGRGEEFDKFIAAVGVLERSFSGTTVQLITALRQIMHLDRTGPKQELRIDWDEFINARTEIPSSWSSQAHLQRATNYIFGRPEISIDNIPVNTHTLLTGLDAIQHADRVNTSVDGISFADNRMYATHLNSLGQVLLSYLTTHNQIIARESVLGEEELKLAFLSNMTFGNYYAAADAFTMQIDENRSLVWNLLSYYTEESSPIKNRFNKWVNELGLKGLQGRNFANLTGVFPLIEKNTLKAYLYLGQKNGRNSNELTALDEAESGTPIFRNLQAISAFTTDIFLDVLALLVASQKEQPAVLTWNRLEGRPQSDEFENALRAEIRDPLWMLCRQYQMGEFHGEDAGSAIEARVQMQTSAIGHLALGANQVKPYDAKVPVEMLIEQQAASVDLLTVMEVAREWKRIFRAYVAEHSVSDDIQRDIQARLINRFPLPNRDDDPTLKSNPSAYAALALLSRTGHFDAYKLFLALTGEDSVTLFDVFEVATPEQETLAATFIDWVSDVIQPYHADNSEAWHPSHLEYQAACSVPVDQRTVSVLVADEYVGGHLDWYAFDHHRNPSGLPDDLIPDAPDTSNTNLEVSTVIPSIITYPGMPLPRWWQMEDYAISFDQLNIDKSDSSTLAFAEFVTLYSNDWLMIPYAVPNGSLCEVKHLIVKDVFGQYTLVKPAGSKDTTDWQRWSMFDLHQRGRASTADHRLFLPPSLARSYEGPPVEQINFLRDEMANMVWGVENIISDGLSGGMDGFEAAQRLRKVIQPSEQADMPAHIQKTNAEIKYQLGTDVPENWIPFIPVRKGDAFQRAIQLQRAAMPRIVNGEPIQRVRPRTSLLSENYTPDLPQKWNPYYIYEEEVPRSGTLLTKRWQRTRWYNGKTVLWLANHKQTGVGQGSSGLQFDRIVPNDRKQ